MNKVKILLSVYSALAGALYASAWWAAITISWERFWLLPMFPLILAVIVALLGGGIYLSEHWND